MKTKEINTTATQHALTKTESMYFENMINQIQNKFDKIVKENNLTGHWTISQDYKWLVKTGD